MGVADWRLMGAAVATHDGKAAAALLVQDADRFCVVATAGDAAKAVLHELRVGRIPMFSEYEWTSIPAGSFTLELAAQRRYRKYLASLTKAGWHVGYEWEKPAPAEERAAARFGDDDASFAARRRRLQGRAAIDQAAATGAELLAAASKAVPKEEPPTAWALPFFDPMPNETRPFGQVLLWARKGTATRWWICWVEVDRWSGRYALMRRRGRQETDGEFIERGRGKKRKLTYERNRPNGTRPQMVDTTDSLDEAQQAMRDLIAKKKQDKTHQWKEA